VDNEGGVTGARTVDEHESSQRTKPIGQSSTPARVRPLTYSQHAQDYDRLTRAFTGVRRAIVGALPLSPGEVVLDVGCGTGLCFPMLLDKVGRHGHIVGIDASPQMLAVARDRVAQQGWRNITLVRTPIDQASIPVTADAALLCAVHDVLRSPQALRRVVESLRPAAWVAAGGGKWAQPWMVPFNAQVKMLHAPFVDSFEGFDRPWSHLEQLLNDVHVDEMAWGTGFVATGQVP
jgi:trans-aconitate methyltransferase